jgi:glycosyltransferase A (GT-A) superfamily protein (DUF2064 family)
MNGVTVVIMAKECIPGRVKTRLHPPFSLEDAAQIAQAALDDTIAAVRGVDVRRVLCVQGALPETPGFEQIPQSAGGLDDRIADVLDRLDGPVLLIGMDTPQIDPELLRMVARRWPLGVDAWFGPASDGGFWLLGLRDRLAGGMPRGDLVRGVPMSRDDTGAVQRARLVDAGLSVADLPMLTDIDDIDSLRTVSAELDGSSALARLLDAWGLTPVAGGAS